MDTSAEHPEADLHPQGDEASTAAEWASQQQAPKPVDPEADELRSALVAASEMRACRAALAARRVTFHDVATAWFRLCDPALSPEDREAFCELYPQLLESFARPRGGIVTAYLCRHIRVAAVLTDAETAAENSDRVLEERPEGAQRGQNGNGENGHRRARLPLDPLKASSSAIHIEPIFGDPEDWKAKEILFSCLELHYRALEFLAPKPRKICLRMIFCVITALLGSLDGRKAAAQTPRAGTALEPGEVAGLEHELRRAARYLDRSMQRQAQLEYFIGMVLGSVLVLGAFVATAVLGEVLYGVDLLGDPLMLSALAGALGAVVSVMQRMTSGGLRLVSEDGKGTVRILGAIRPVLGAALGIVLYVLLAAELLPFDTPAGGSQLQFYVVGLAFIAGFSERFAQDMLTGAAGGLTSTPAAAAVSPDPALSERELAVGPR
ncbi:MAG TPA: hypothetical protein VEQ61_02785 [Thermoleophilaceae bacterium]|nr:hypothetical protein [Thermoleophilaceae bacterium]